MKQLATGVADERDPRQRFDDLLDALWPMLNTLHGMDRSRRFWGILLHRFIAKYLVAARFGGPFGSPPPVLTSDEPVLGVRFGDEAGTASAQNAPAWRRLPDPRDLALRGAVAWRLRHPWTRARSVVLGFHHYNTIAGLVPQPAARLRTASNLAVGGWDNEARERLMEGASQVAGAARQAVAWLPSWYVEEFRACYDRTPVSDPEAKEFHASFLSTPEERMTVARHVEAGARLTFYQHAAMYGEVPDHFMYFAETSLGDRLRTWGWRQGSNDEPFVALRLMQPRHHTLAAQPEARRILYALVRQPLPGLIEHTFATQRRFIDAMGERAAEVIVRPRVNKGGAGALQVPADLQPRIAGIDGGRTPLTSLVARVRLVVLDMIPSTLFMECVTADVPVVAIVPEDTVFTPMAAEFYDEFLELGLLHRSPEDAARFAIGLDAARWWRDVRSRDCFREYLQTFCNRDVSRIARPAPSRAVHSA